MDRRELYGKNKVIIMAVIAGAVIACAVAVFIGIVSEKYVYITELERPGAGRERAYSVDVMYDGYVEELDIRIHERALGVAELEELYRVAGMELENVARGNNESFESVTQPLELTDRLDKYNMSIRWYIEDWNIIDYTGQIYQGSKLQKTHITAAMKYEGRTMQADEGREYVYEVNVLPYTEDQLRSMELENMISVADEMYSGSDVVHLPGEYKGKEVLYRVRKDNSYSVLLLLIPVIVLLLTAKKRSDERDGRKKTEELLTEEYPEIISKLALLIGAGMTPYNAISRIAADGKGEAYKRLSGVVKRIQSGASEREQYLRFGTIFGVYCYSKLGTLLEQNIVRGNEQFRMMLKNECIEALEERKARARKKGEQAGTKMLFPMLLMLMVVMVVIMVPAFMSF